MILEKIIKKPMRFSIEITLSLKIKYEFKMYNINGFSISYSA